MPKKGPDNYWYRGKRRCGARTRKGGRCMCRELYRSGRCKFHGGASTGPRTEAGKQRSREAAAAYWVKWRAERAAAQQIT
jgi:hypothetical protein